MIDDHEALVLTELKVAVQTLIGVNSAEHHAQAARIDTLCIRVQSLEDQRSRDGKELAVLRDNVNDLQKTAEKQSDRTWKAVALVSPLVVGPLSALIVSILMK